MPIDVFIFDRTTVLQLNVIADEGSTAEEILARTEEHCAFLSASAKQKIHAMLANIGAQTGQLTAEANGDGIQYTVSVAMRQIKKTVSSPLQSAPKKKLPGIGFGQY